MILCGNLHPFLDSDYTCHMGYILYITGFKSFLHSIHVDTSYHTSMSVLMLSFIDIVSGMFPDNLEINLRRLAACPLQWMIDLVMLTIGVLDA